MADYEHIWDKVKDIWNDKIPGYVKYCGTTLLIASLASLFSYEGVKYIKSVPSEQTGQVGSTEAGSDENKKTETPKKPKSHIQERPGRKKPDVNININNKKINTPLKYNGASDSYSLELNYDNTNLTPVTEATSEGDVSNQPHVHQHPTQTNIVQPLDGRLDGYNITAKFFPQGYRSPRPGETAPSSSLEIITEDNDYGRATLSSIKPGQYIIIQPNDFNKENFLEEVEIYYNSEDARKYFNLSATDKSIFITPKIEYLQGINTGTLKIKIPIKNKYGTTEQETLEIILGE